MKNRSLTFEDVQSLKMFLSSDEVQSDAKSSSSILIQILSSQDKMNQLEGIIAEIKNDLPMAVIVSITTVGEIYQGQLQLGTILLSISFFKTTTLSAIHKSYSAGNEFADGQELANSINQISDVAGVLLYGTPLTLNMSAIFHGMSEAGLNFPVFGGGAATYDLVSGPMIFYEDVYIANGIVAIVFISTDLHIYATSHLGWRCLSKKMEITRAHGKVVDTIDHIRAYDLYNNYLDIKGDDQFYFNALEFPLLLERNGFMLARVPFLVQDGAIEFCGELLEGETVRIGYGNPQTIISESSLLQKEIYAFRPQAIFIFSCVCRRFLLQDAINFEMKPFEDIAPTTGFFCSGEFYNANHTLELLNSTMVVVGMRENNQQPETACPDFRNGYQADKQPADPYIDKHSRIVTRLLHYISVQTSELEEANQELKHLAEIDNLTQIYNRMKLDHIILSEIENSISRKTIFSLILLDIDYFKNINDTYGHLVGDEVLIQIAKILKRTVRQTDSVGRWGGEEFLLILPQTDQEQACILAERIRSEIQTYPFASTQPLTCSFGVTSYQDGDSKDKMLQRADKAMYQVKKQGRNMVLCCMKL